MARVIVHSGTGPRKIDEADIDEEKGNVAICQCGLSGEYLFSDGTHRVMRGEPDGTLFEYDDEATVRRAVHISAVEDGGSSDGGFNPVDPTGARDE